LVHGAVRELKEETGLEATRIVGKVGEFSFRDKKADGSEIAWRKHIFEMEVRDLETIVLDPAEHQAHLFASEDEIVGERVGNVQLEYISPANKAVNVEAFRRRGGAAGERGGGEGEDDGRSAAALDGSS
jgi:8-oxo-dGTP pyrophosphatase MutT (NUDIX family)